MSIRTVSWQLAFPASGAVGTKPGNEAAMRFTLQRRTDALTAATMNAGGSSVKSISLPVSVVTRAPLVQRQPRRSAVRTVAQAGPRAEFQGFPSEATAASIALRLSQKEFSSMSWSSHLSHHAFAHILSGRMCAVNAGSMEPAAPSTV